MSTDLRTEINDCEDHNTTFSTSGAGPATITLAGEFYEGTAAVDAQHSNNDDELYTTTDSGGTNLNINMNDVTAYAPVKDSLLQTFANRGMQILLGDGTDRIGYSVGGNDAKGMPIGPFFNVYKLDVSEIVAAPGTNFAVYAGSEAALNQGAVTQFGVGTFHNAKAQGNVNNIRLDRMTYHANGSYALRINGGTVGTPETMADVSGDDGTNGWGLVSNPLGELYYFFGPTEWGEPAANADAYFEANGEQWFWIGDNGGGRAVGATHFPFRVVANATDTISFVLNNVVIVNTGTAAEFDCSDTNIDTFELSSVTLTDVGAITMPPAGGTSRFANDCIFNNCGQVYLDDLVCDGLVFNGSQNALGAILWDAGVDEEAQDNLTFNSDGTGHAIEISLNTASLTTFNIDGYSVTGYETANDGTTGNTVFLVDNAADGDVTINVSNGIGTFSYERASGYTGTVTINQTVTITITVQDTAGDPIEGAKVFLEESGGTDIISFDVTNVSGIVTTSYAGSTPQAVVGYVAKGSAIPVYKRVNINDTIGASGLSATITMVSDE